MSRFARLLCLGLLFVGVTAPAAAAEPYVIDAARSSVRFLVPYNFMIVGLVEGQFREFSGRAAIDRAAIERSSVEVELSAASLDTALAARDLGLRSDLFFAAREHPTIRFDGREVRRSDDGLELVGMLTLRGVEKPVVVPFEMLDFGDDVVVLGRVTIPRQPFGLTGPMPSPEFTIGESALVELHLTLVRAE